MASSPMFSLLSNDAFNPPPVKPKKSLIMVAFYSPGADDHPWNHIVSRFSGPVCHVELAFPDSYVEGDFITESMESVCVYMNEKVELRKKRYSRDNYHVMCFNSTEQMVAKVRAEADKMVENGVMFSRYSMMATFMGALPLWYAPRVSAATCCSILSAQLLQVAGIIPASINARRVTPMGLQKICMGGYAAQFVYFGVVPAKLHQITTPSRGTVSVPPPRHRVPVPDKLRKTQPPPGTGLICRGPR
jgi:hypothetical protein